MTEDRGDDGPDLAAEALAAIRSREPKPPTSAERAAGWRWIWIAAAAVLAGSALFAVNLGALEPSPGGCMAVESWTYVWLFFSPIVAAISVLVPGVVAAVVAPWTAPLRLGALLVVAFVGAWVPGLLASFPLALGCVVSNVVQGAVTIVLPSVLGIALVVWTVRRRQGAMVTLT